LGIPSARGITSPIFPTSTSRGARVRVVTSAAGAAAALGLAFSDMAEAGAGARIPTLSGGELSTRHPLSSWPPDGPPRKLSFVKKV
jgi:hypothetical protein